MTVIHEKISLYTKGNNDLIDITMKIQGIIRNSNAKNSLVTISALNPYVCLFCVNYELEGKDLISQTDSLVPFKIENDNYEKLSDIKSALFPHSVTFPVTEGEIQIPDTQKIVLIDFDTKPSFCDVIISQVY